MQLFKILGLILLIAGNWQTARSQSKYKCENGFVSFYSSAPLEDIYAENNTLISLIDLSKKQIAFVAIITDFRFKKSLMQQHFNEKYMESHKYPKATFSGTMVSSTSLHEKGRHIVTVKGDLSIHGVTRNIQVEGVIDNQGSVLSASSEFIIRVADYDIKIPKLLVKNIAEEVLVKVKLDYQLTD